MTSARGKLSPVGKLNATHDANSFACGNEALDRFLKRLALANQRADSARTYVVCRDSTVVAYHSLAAASMEHGDAPPRVVRGLARHPVPVILLARLVVDRAWQECGLGKAFVKRGARASASPFGWHAMHRYAVGGGAR